MPLEPTRRGSVLIIVVGLASILLTLAVAFLARMRSDSRAMLVVVADSQARLMLHAATMYLQESSRLGWGDGTGECFGWTDVRDGGLGPRGPRPAGAAGDGNGIPAPAWYRWPGYKYDADDADLPAVSARRGGWPLPGTATRCPMALAVRTPYATQLTAAYNPVSYPVPYDGSAAWEVPWDPNAPGTNFWDRVGWSPTWLPSIFNAGAGSAGMLDPQPVARDWDSFRTGALAPSAVGTDWVHEDVNSPGMLQQLAVVPGSENLSWFRIYRELQADHDDIDNVGKPGTEWWDKVALYNAANPADPTVKKLRNWSVFIVTCGAGGTRGYRFWDDAEIGAWETDHGLPAGTGRALEPVTASESGLFTDRKEFVDLLASSRILWFRCEWSGLESGARSASVYNASVWRDHTYPFNNDGKFTPTFNWNDWVQRTQYTAQYAQTEVIAGSDGDTRTYSPRVFGGNIKWLQRLDRDPVIW